ncbi:MAG: nucleotidyltransferase domain-containing protein [Elusimicrobia bacterium]|nr:nucleotidyltransferase domain-containing protein [Candidatus Liberimonas magnetica]
MEYKNVLDSLLGQKVKVKILRHLAFNSGQQSGREIAAAADINHWQCHKVLREFCAHGIVKVKKTGSMHLFVLNKEHYFVKNTLIPLFKSEKESIVELTKDIGVVLLQSLGNLKNEILSIILFGSLASENEKPKSDIDVLVIIKNIAAKDKIIDIASGENTYFMEHFGNTLSPYILTINEFIKKAKKGDKLISNIIKSGKTVYGKTPGEIITI